MVAPWGSATNRTPSGPKARAVADFRSGVPFFNPGTSSARAAGTNARVTRAARRRTREIMARSFRTNTGGDVGYYLPRRTAGCKNLFGVLGNSERGMRSPSPPEHGHPATPSECRQDSTLPGVHLTCSHAPVRV